MASSFAGLGSGALPLGSSSQALALGPARTRVAPESTLLWLYEALSLPRAPPSNPLPTVTLERTLRPET
jgi:hypothetical protein